LDILLVTARYPWPARRGDQIRTTQTLGFLTPEHRVTLLTPRPAAVAPPVLLPPGAEMLTYAAGAGIAKTLGVAGAAIRGLPLQSGLFTSPDLHRQLRLLAPRFHLVVLQLVRLAAYCDDLGAVPVLVDLIDDLALNFRRRARIDKPWRRPVLALEARLLERAQRRLASRAGAVTLVCDRDRGDLLRHLPVALAGRVVVASLAVQPPAPSGAPQRAALQRLVFTGNLGYFVNADAIAWWLREVWPAVAGRHPALELVVAGDRPSPAVRHAVAGGGPRVSLLAPAPDLSAVLAGATLAIAPLRCGSGVPVKVLEAWAAGVPVVATSWAAAGTTAVAGQDLLLADSRQEWLAALGSLLHDPEARARLAAAGLRRLAADYSAATAKAQLLAAVAAAAGRGV
jgi:glycosyltransferase involved in cell wall biosynthesis